MGAGWNAPAGVPWSPDISLGDIAGLQSPAGSPLGTSDQQAAISNLQSQTPQPPPTDGGAQSHTPQPPPPTATGTADPGSNVISGTTPVDQYGNALDASNTSFGTVFNQMGGALQLEPFDFAKRYGEYNTATQNAMQSSLMPHLDPAQRPPLWLNLLTFGGAGLAHHDYETRYNAAVDKHNSLMHEQAAQNALDLTRQDATYHVAGLNRQMNALGLAYKMSQGAWGDQLKWINTYKDFLRPPPSPDEAEMLANNGRHWEPVMGNQGMIFDKNGPVAPIRIPPPPFGGVGGGSMFPGTWGSGSGGMSTGPTGGGGTGGGGGYGGPTGRGAAPVHARPVNPQSPYGRTANDNPTGSAPGKPPTQNAPAPGGAAPSDPTTQTTTAPPTTAGGTPSSTTGTTLYTTENRAQMEGMKNEAKAFATAKGKSKEQFEAAARTLENSLNSPDYDNFANHLLPANVGRNTVAGAAAVLANQQWMKAQRLAGNDPAKLVDLNNMKRQLDNIITNLGVQGGRSSSGMRASMDMLRTFEGQWQDLAAGKMSREAAMAFRKSMLDEIQKSRAAIDGLQWVPPSQRGTPPGQGGSGGVLTPGMTGKTKSGIPFTINPQP